MNTIWKFTITLNDEFELELPAGSIVLSVQSQFEEGQLWVLVNPLNKKVKRKFYIAGTGHPIDTKGKNFIGTFQTSGGNYVWHVFESVQLGGTELKRIDYNIQTVN